MNNTNLIKELARLGKISEEKKNELEIQIEKSGEPEEDLLLKTKLVPEEELFEIKSKLLNIPYTKLSKEEEIPLEVLELISEEAAMNYKMIPLFKKGNTIGVGMVYPENILAQNALRFLANKGNFSYETYIISQSDLNNVLKQHGDLKRETKRALTEFSKEKSEILIALAKGSTSVEMTEEAPIIKMVLVILRHAIEGNASDIHIEPGKEKLNIRFRQDGVLHLSLFLPLNVHPSIVSRIKILANLKIDEIRVPQDG